MSILAVSILGLVPAELYYNIITPGTHSAVRKLKKKKKRRKAFHGRGAHSTREISVHWQTKQAVSDFLISQSMTRKPYNPRSLHVGCK